MSTRPYPVLMDQLPVPLTVTEAFVAAFRPYVERVVEDIGLPASEGVDDAISIGEQWLETELAEMSKTPAHELRHGPLEIFREATRFPTAALEAAGVVPTTRGDAERRALPGDVYGIAPATSRDLGADAFNAHVAWGVERAQGFNIDVTPRPVAPKAMQPPVAAIADADPQLREAITASVKILGYTATAWRNPGEADAAVQKGAVSVAIISADHPAADEMLRICVAKDVPVFVTGESLDDLSQARFTALGAVGVVPTQLFVQQASRLLPKIG